MHMKKKVKIIGMKELQNSLSRVTREVDAGRSFIVLKHARPAFRIEPMPSREKKTHTLADLYDIRFKTGDRNLSKKVDRILYGRS